VAGAGVPDEAIMIIVGTGMHRPSTQAELEHLVGRETLTRFRVVDHTAEIPATLVQVSDEPYVAVNGNFAEADFRIVTGFIEPHFMAGFSGGRKGVCPALVDLDTIQRFHGFRTLSHQLAVEGVLEGNPCHETALSVARETGVDFLFNVAINRRKEIIGIYCGELETAHGAGCHDVAACTTARPAQTFDIVVTCGGGYPLDQNFYQTVKAICMALPALHAESTLVVVSHCREQLGSPEYTDLMKRYAGRWRDFLADLAARPDRTEKDQWELQMQCRVLERVGQERILLVSDGLEPELQKVAGVTPVLGPAPVAERLQQTVDRLLREHPGASIAVIPDGPYTMLKPGAGP
jgi:nickel-dependent lactate racemase